MGSRTRTTVISAALALVLPLVACSDDDGGDEPIELTGAAQDLAEEGTIRIGVKYDQPGVGSRPPGADAPEGFDIEIGRIIADRLGITRWTSPGWRRSRTPASSCWRAAPSTW